MQNKEFDKVLKRRIALIRKILQQKGDEYAGDKDRLHNFKRAAEIDETTPEAALKGMWLKQLVSVLDIIKKITDENKKIGLNFVLSPEHVNVTQKLVDEKIGDAINYLILLEALIKERRDYCA